MLEELANVKGLEIYSPDGLFVGKADKIVLDVANRRVSGIFVENPSPVLADDGVSIKIPYRWVQSIGDVIILKAFPKHIFKDGTVE